MELIKIFIRDYGSYILTVISIIITIISFVLKNKCNNTSKKLFRIIQILPEIINKAESIFALINKSGACKLEYCLNEIQVICIECGLNFDVEFWKSKIEEYLSVPQKNK